MALVPRDWSRILVRNHDEKTKDMSRSVLPSSWRVGARETRRAIHKRRRARQRDALAAARGATPEIRDTYRAEIAGLVFTRRFYDKEAPLVRWAQATVAADPALRQAPRGGAGRLLRPPHAAHPDRAARGQSHRRGAGLGRSRRLPGLSGGTAHRSGRRDRAPGPPDPRRRPARHAQREPAHGIQPPGWPHGEAGEQRQTLPRRLLLGAHDAAAFAREMAGYPQARAVIATVAALAEL